MILRLILFLIFVSSINTQEQKDLIELKILFKAKHTFKTVNGECQKPTFEGLIIKEKVPASEFTIICSLSNMKTGNSNRDSHMKEVLGFPKEKQIEFSVKKTLIVNGAYEFIGILKINGKENNKTFKGVISKKENLISINGKEKITLSEFSINAPALLFVSVDDSIEIEFEAKVKE